MLAAALAALGVVELALTESLTPLQVGVTLGCTLPLVARRQHPVLASALLAAALTLLTVAGTDTFPFAVLVALLVGAYTLGAVAGPRRGALGLAVLVAAGVANSAGPPGRELGDVVFPVLLVAGPYVAGRALAVWRARSAELERLNEDLLRERRQVEALAVAAERHRIARELHDVLAQSLTTIVLHAEAAEEALDRDPARARVPLERLLATGRDALNATRDVLGVLRARGERHDTVPRLEELTLLVDQVRAAGLEVELVVEGIPRPLPPMTELGAYRIAQEALTNTLKHARASKAHVCVTYGDDAVEVSVSDDGTAQPSGDGGLGLVGMRERASLAGGTTSAGPLDGGGWMVVARLPAPGGPP